MNLFYKLKIAYRKISLPIKSSDLVIDVGSGGNPHIWADVTTDMYENNEQRFTELKFKGLFVWSNAEKLPFKSKKFDYSISSHVLEHTAYPERMISELERISKAGYIETPPSWQELVCPYKMHFSRVTIENNVLVFKIKSKFDEALPPDFEDIEMFIKEFKKYTENNYVPFTVNKLFWKNSIRYRVIREKNYQPFELELEIETDREERSFLHNLVKKLIEKLFTRNKKINELDVLCCPKCLSDLMENNQILECTKQKCKQKYPKYKGCWDFRDVH
jgi:ubiquinone/menaquinone biosynthesis C-methylase UbiE